MAENGQNFFDFGAMPPTPDFVRVRQSGNAYHKPQQPADGTAKPRPPQSQSPKKPPPQPTSHVAKPKNSGLDLLRMFNLKGLSMDSDRTLILAVIFLLLGDTSDELLLLALLYIMI